MLNTVVSVAAAVALLLPGFVIAEIAKSGRARASESDLELALRALFFALILHASFAWWTRWLVIEVGRPAGWVDHLSAILVYAGMVLVAVPIAAGVGLNLYLRRSEATQGSLTLAQRILGGRDARDAWDYLFPQLVEQGAWLIAELEGGDPAHPRLVGGKFGKESAVGQSPSEHNLYLQEMWTVSPDFPRNLVEPLRPQRGLWLPASSIRSIQVLNPPGTGIQWKAR